MSRWVHQRRWPNTILIVSEIQGHRLQRLHMLWVRCAADLSQEGVQDRGLRIGQDGRIDDSPAGVPAFCEHVAEGSDNGPVVGAIAPGKRTSSLGGGWITP